MNRLLWVSLITCMWCGFSNRVAASDFRTVALAGNFPPETPKLLPIDGGVVGLVEINDLGLASLVSTEVDPDDPFIGFRRYWSEEATGPRLVASEGDLVPLPGGGIEIDFLRFGVNNDLGQSFVFTELSGPGVDHTNSRASWIEEAGSLHLVARSGDPVPGFADGVVFSPFRPGVAGGPLGFNAAGQVLLIGELIGPGIDETNDDAIFLGDKDSLRLIARAGDPAPGMPPGVNMFHVLPPGESGSVSGVPLNDAGQSVLNVSLIEDDGSTLPDGNAIYVEDAGSFRLVVKTGDPAPGFPDDVVFKSTQALSIDAAGQTAFGATLEGPGFDNFNSSSLWSESGDSPSLVAILGDPAPGTDPGVTIQSFDQATVGGAGDVVFQANLTGPGVVTGNRAGIWSNAGGTLELIARRGDQAPGIPDGIVFEDFSLGWVNEAGQFSLKARAGENDPFTFGDEVGVWATDTTGELQLIVRKGDELEVAPGVFRTVQGVSINESQDDAESPSLRTFNARGQLAFSAIFTDGSSGVFVTDRVAGNVDETPPELVSGSEFDILWPPNHTMAEIPVQLQASDDQTPIVELVETLVVTVSSNEPDSRNNGDPPGDVHGIDGFTAPVDLSDLFSLNEETGLIDGTINLRSERFGFGDGRIYSLEATIADAAGNESNLMLDFPVPHDLGAVKTVPEPSTSILLAVSVCAFFCGRRRIRR